MRRFAGYAAGTNTVSTSLPLCAVYQPASATSRAAIYDIICGSDATPADNAGKFSLRRGSAFPGTATVVTANALDPADPAALCLFQQVSTVTPTMTASSNVFDWAQNSRATFRWVAAPDGEFILAATNNAGLGLLSITAAGAAVVFVETIMWRE